jgi:tetratricopeptide (TPR) repeat protein
MMRCLAKYLLILSVLWLSSGALAQNKDGHLKQLIHAINQGDYSVADQEAMLVQQLGCEQEHAFSIQNMDHALGYLQHCPHSGLPQWRQDSIALYLVEECGRQINELSNKGKDFEKLCLLGIRMCEISMCQRHQDYAVLLFDMGLVCQQHNEIEQAAEYGRRAVEVFIKNGLEKNNTYCTIAGLAGGYYCLLNDYVSAYPYLKDAYEVCMQTSGEKHPYYSFLLNTYGKLEGNLGGYYTDRGEFDEGIKHYLNDLELLKKTPESDGQYAVVLNNLSTAYGDKGDYPNALKYGKESLVLRKKLYGEKSAEYALAVIVIGTTYMSQGNYQQALSCYQQAKELFERLSIRNNYYAQVLNDLGVVYDEMGEYKQSENYHLQAKQLYKELFGENSSNYASSLSNLGILYLQLGDLKKARLYCEQSLSIYEYVYGKDHITCATVLNNLGTIFDHQRDFDMAEYYYDRALAINKKTFGTDHSDVGSVLNNLGLLYDHKGEYQKAIEYHKEALSVRKRLFGEKNIHTADSYVNLGGAYDSMKDYENSILYYSKGYDILHKLFGDHHPNTVQAMSNLGFAYYNKGDYKNAVPLLVQCYNIRKQQYLRSLEFMTEAQRDTYWNAMSYEFDFVIPNMVNKCINIHPEYAGLAYDNLLFYKGILLRSADAIKHSIIESGDKNLIRQWNELHDLHTQMIALETSDPSSSSLQTLRQQAEEIEKEMTRTSSVYRQSHQLDSLRWTDVRSALSSKQVAVEFGDFIDLEGFTHYYALVVRPEDKYPKYISLFNEWMINKLLAKTTTDAQYTYTESGGTLSRTIWGKILPYLQHGDTVYYSASGVLHQIAIETLPVSEEHTMNSMYHMVRLSSTRELVIPHNQIPSQSSATLYGGIYYDVDMSDLAAQSMSYRKLAMDNSRAVVDESMRTGVHYLPGTKREVEQIRDILQHNHISTKVYTSDAANEESFKALSGQKRNILHIATHGFYWSDSTAHQQRLFSNGTFNPEMTPVTIDPLRRSGLLFAGANIALRGHSKDLPANVQDGILTSKEISLMDLRDADMVILSACETGKGEITGEGVFGLQRAFKMAGVQTILMSLWPVDDDATQMMMSSFYRHWILHYETKRDAFLHAQEEVKQKYPQPSYWAAFVLLD